MNLLRMLDYYYRASLDKTIFVQHIIHDNSKITLFGVVSLLKYMHMICVTVPKFLKKLNEILLDT